MSNFKELQIQAIEKVMQFLKEGKLEALDQFNNHVFTETIPDNMLFSSIQDNKFYFREPIRH